MSASPGPAARFSSRRGRPIQLKASAAITCLVTTSLSLVSCGSADDEPKTAAEKHTIILEATSDYGRPMEIGYFGHATGGRDGIVTIGKEEPLAAMSPWKVTLTVEGDNPWINLTANGTGCRGAAIGGNSCEFGAIPERADIQGKGIHTCRITIDGKVMAEESYTYPTIVPVTCIGNLGG